MMIKTRGSRFTAASGLRVKERCSIGTTALLTIHVLGWSVWLIAMPDSFATETVRFFGALSVVASIAILVLSLLDYALSRSVDAEKLQQNALEISVLLRELERELCSPMPNIDRMKQIAQSYEAGLVSTQINHSPSDYRKWAIRTSEATTFWQKLIRWFYIVTYDMWYYMSSMIIHVVLVSSIIILTVWYLRYHG